MSQLTAPKLPAIAAVAGIKACVIGLALWHAPSHAATAASPQAAGIPLLVLAKDELQDPQVFQSRGGVLDMLMVAQALTRAEVGWIRQHPELLKNVRPIEGLIALEGMLYRL